MAVHSTFRRFPPLAALAITAGSASIPASAQFLFTDVTAELGLSAYRSRSGDFHGPGGVFADLDEDGYPELYLPSAAPDPANRLFLNVDHDGVRRFERASNDAGAGNLGNATGAIAGDYDNDGDLDLYVINFDQPNALLRNQLTETGVLVFTDVTAETDPTPGKSDEQHGVGMAFHEGVPLDNSLTAAWSDIDRDGDLDLYVGNHNGYNTGPPPEGPFDVPGRRDILYRNEGDGTFTDVTMVFGVTGFETADGAYETPLQRFSSTNAVIFADFDNDRWPDLLVTNKIGGAYDRDMLYINRGLDAFDTWLGFELVTYDLVPEFGRVSGAAMGVDVGDPDNDGDLDVYITDWSDPQNPDAPGTNDLYVNQLSETGELAFVHSGRAPAKFSWGTLWQDFDNDGRQELHVATNVPFLDFLYANVMSDIVDLAGEAGVAVLRDARGTMSADCNRDGWMDLFVIMRDDDASVLFENEAAAMTDHHFLSIRLRGEPNRPGRRRATRDAIGARVRVHSDANGDGIRGPSELQLREVVSGSSCAASTSSLEVEFGLGQGRYPQVEILWPDGTRSGLLPRADRFYEIDQRTHRRADLDGSGEVAYGDLVLLLREWGECPEAPGLCPADIDGDGSVGHGDLQRTLQSWG